MKSNPFLSLVLLAFALPFPAAAEVQSYALGPGPNAVGVALVRPKWLTGTLGALDAAGMRVQDTAVPGLALSAPFPWENQPAYLEISSAPAQANLAGERYEVDVTQNPANAQGWIRLKANPANTRRDLPAGLIGATYVIRPHWTLGNLFGGLGSSALRTGRAASSADEVQITEPSSGVSEGYFLCNDPAASGWRLSRNRKGPEQSQAVLRPGTALLVHAKGPLVFSLFGEARTNAFRLPLRAGPNFVSGGHRLALRLTDLAGPSATAFRAAPVAASADRVSFLVGSRQEVFFPTPGTDGVRWICSTATYPGEVRELELFPPNRGFWIHKQQADPAFTIPAPR